jgi:hypothetical protein
MEPYDSTQDRMDDAVRSEKRVAVRSHRDAYQAAKKAVRVWAAKAGPRFEQGEVVEANVTAQGLVQHGHYVVASADVQSLPFGDVVTYYLRHYGESADSKQIRVVNGHLLLTRFSRTIAQSITTLLKEGCANDRTGDSTLDAVSEIFDEYADLLTPAVAHALGSLAKAAHSLGRTEH